MTYNLATRSKGERGCVNVDLALSGVAYKERMNQPVTSPQVEMAQQFSKATNPV